MVLSNAPQFNYAILQSETLLFVTIIICVWIQKMHRTNLLTDLQNIGSVHDEANSFFSTVYHYFWIPISSNDILRINRCLTAVNRH